MLRHHALDMRRGEQGATGQYDDRRTKSIPAELIEEAAASSLPR
jgi:hypothetical protein